jgi:ligand-binding sensor domain-containing protein
MNSLRSWMIRGCGVFLLPCSVFALDPSRSVFQYNCQNWTRRNGLPVSGVTAITQTRDGHLWLGTHNGLVRFDGMTFTSVGLLESRLLRSYSVQCLKADPSGGLWFGLVGSSHGYYDGQGQWHLGTDSSGSADWDVKALEWSRDGKLLVAGTRLSGFRTKDGQVESIFGAVPEDDPINVNAAFKDSRGGIWLGTARRGLFYWRDGTLTRFPDPALDESIIRAIAEDQAGQLWIGTQAGPICYDAQSRRKEIAFPRNAVTALLLDARGSLWIGLADDGVARWRDDGFTLLRKSDGLVSDAILCLAEDREGSLWVGTKEGLSQLTDVKFATLTEHEGMFGRMKQSVSASPRGGMWAATDEGIVYFDGRGTLYSTNAGLQDVFVKRVFEARNGDVFLVRGRNEIEVLSEGKVIARHETKAMPVAFTEDAHGVVVSVAGELYRVSRNALEPFPYNVNEPPQLYWVVNLMTARDGAIWVSCVNGICRIKDGQYQQWTTLDGLEDYSVRWLCEDKDGVIWAGTSTGIARLKDNRIRNIRRENGLFDANI